MSTLSTEQAPPISIPLRFFVVAPLFLLLAAALTVKGIADASVLLAVTHCITLGFMALAMLGAIQQILPVVIGSPMPAPRLVAWLSFLPLILGTLSLVSGFLLGEPALLDSACLLLGCAFLIFILASLISLSRAPASNASKTAILLSLLALAGTVTLGLLLASGHASGAPLNYTQLSALHISAGLGGWVMLLIVGVSYQVVPMFQLTPGYPEWLSASLAPALFTALMLYVSAKLLDAAPLSYLAEGIYGMLAAGFAGVTLRLQSRRRRRVADATLGFFRLAMGSLLCASLLWLAALFSPHAETMRLLSVATFMLGFALSVIHGMLYKIIPFLVWFHLFRGGIKKGVPNMKEIIPENWMWWHLRLHSVTLLVAVLAVFWSPLPLALCLALQSLLLGIAMYTGIAVYRRTLQRLVEI